MNEIVSIALVDDQDLVREGVKSLLALSGRVKVVLEARDGDGLLVGIDAASPEVVVMDIRMPARDGFSALAELRRRGNPTPVLLLTTFDDNALCDRAIETGAQGFMLKNTRPEQLIDAIFALARGGRVFQPQPTSVTTPDTSLPGRDAPALSEREIAILRLMAGGYANREIARALFLAEGTVKNYVSDILAKLDARDRTQAALKAISWRLI